MALVTVQIADKTTLDSVDSKVTSVKSTVESTSTTVGTINSNLGDAKSDLSTIKSNVTTLTSDTSEIKARGGIRYNSTTSKLQGYDITNDSWEDINISSGGGSPVLTIVNEDMEMTGWTITVTHESGRFTETETMPNEASLEIEVPYLGEYEVEYYQSSTKKGVTVIEVTSASNYIVEMSLNFGTFSSLTWEEINRMCNAYYNGQISDLSQYWSVGDTKSINIAAMSATGVGESHEAQTRQIAIIGFAHDTLTTPINDITKAAVTLELVDCLNTQGYINSTNTNKTGWTSSARRTWCNNVFYDALPSDLSSIIKPVNKLTSVGNQSTTIKTDSDKCWLPSAVEVVSSSYTQYAQTGEGSQYSYYTTVSNRQKKINGSTVSWWFRSPYKSNSTYWCRYGSSVIAADYSSNPNGLAPAFCI